MGVLWYWKNVSNKNSSCAEAGQVVIDRLFMEGAGPLLHHQDSRHKLSMTSAHIRLCFISAMENMSISKEVGGIYVLWLSANRTQNLQLYLCSDKYQLGGMIRLSQWLEFQEF